MRRTTVAVLTLLAAAAVTGCSSSDSDAVVPAAGTVSLEGDDIAMVLPSGRFTFTVTAPRVELTEDEVDDGEARDAPDGKSYVGVSSDWEGSAGRVFALLNRDTIPKSASVALMADGEKIDLFTIDTQKSRTGGPVWALVPEDGDVRLDVTYDGHTQSADLASGEVTAGVAEGFYDLQDHAVACPTQSAGDADVAWHYSIACTVGNVVAVPYVAELGWAEKGRTWLLVQVTLKPEVFRFTAGTESAEYRVDRESGSLTGKNGETVELSHVEDASGSHATYAVPAAAKGPWELELTRTYDLTRTGTAPGAPATRSARYYTILTFGS